MKSTASLLALLLAITASCARLSTDLPMNLTRSDIEPESTPEEGKGDLFPDFILFISSFGIKKGIIEPSQIR